MKLLLKPLALIAALLLTSSAFAEEAEVVITDASVLAHGKAISFELKLEAGEAPSGKMQGVSLFVDGAWPVCIAVGVCNTP